MKKFSIKYAQVKLSNLQRQVLFASLLTGSLALSSSPATAASKPLPFELGALRFLGIFGFLAALGYCAFLCTLNLPEEYRTGGGWILLWMAIFLLLLSPAIAAYFISAGVPN
jgi:hypothetical protein